MTDDQNKLAEEQEKWNPYNLHTAMSSDPAVAGTSPDKATFVTSAIVQGKASDSVVSKSVAFQQQLTDLGPDHPDTIATWRNQPWDGMMTMVEMAYIRNNFQPWNVAAGPQTDVFNKVITDLRNNPAFFLLETQTQTVNRKTSDFNDLLTDTANFLKGAEDLDTQRVTAAVKNLVSAAASHSRTEQQMSLFVVSSVKAPSETELHYRAYYTYVSLLKDKKCGHTTRQDSYVLVSVGFQFNTDWWATTYADEVGQAGMSSLATWLNGNQTPLNSDNDPAKNPMWRKQVGKYQSLSVPLPSPPKSG